MADFERFDAAREGGESEQQELERLQEKLERLVNAGGSLGREINLTKPATAEAPMAAPVAEPAQRPVKSPEKPPETWKERTAERAAKQAEKLRQTFEKAALKFLPRTGQRRVEQVSTLAALAKRLGIRLGLADLTERIAYLRGKGEMPGFMRKAREAPVEKAEPETEEAKEPEEKDLTELTTEEARDESFSRFDSMKAYVENLAERKPENLERMDKVYSLLLKTTSTKFEKWKELASIGLSAAVLATLPLGGSALLRTARMAFGSLNYSTIGFRMGSEWGLRDNITEAQKRYDELKQKTDDELGPDTQQNLAELLALYRAGVRFEQYETNQKGLKFFGKAGEVFQALRQGRLFESGRTFWRAVQEDRKELLKIGGKMLLYSTPLLAAPLSPALAMGFYAGTTAANMVERIIRYRQLSAKEKFERERTQPDPILKQITELADRYERYIVSLGGEYSAELTSNQIKIAQANLAQLADEHYRELQSSRGRLGLTVGAGLGLISAMFFSYLSMHTPAEAAKPEAGRAGAPGAAAGGLTPREGVPPEVAGPSGAATEKAAEEAIGTPGSAAPGAGARAVEPGMATGREAGGAVGTIETTTEAPRGKPQPETLEVTPREWPRDPVERARLMTQLLGTRLREAVPQDFQGFEDLKPNEQITKSVSWFHNGTSYEVGGITNNNEFYLDGQRFKIIEGHYIEVPVDVNPDGQIDNQDIVNGKVVTMKIDINTGRSADGSFAAWDKDVFFKKEWGAAGSHENIRLVVSDRARLDQYGISIGRDKEGFDITHEALPGRPGLHIESFKAYLGNQGVPLEQLDRPLHDYRWEFDHFVYNKDAPNPWLDIAHQRAVLDYSNFEGKVYKGTDLEQQMAKVLEQAAGQSADNRQTIERGDKGFIEQIYDQIKKTAAETALPEALKTGHRGEFLAWIKDSAASLTSEAQKATREAFEQVANQKVAFRIDKNFDSTYWLKIEGGEKPIQLDPVPGFKEFLERFK